MRKIRLSLNDLQQIRPEDRAFLHDRGLNPVFAMMVDGGWFSCCFLPLEEGTMMLTQQWDPEWPRPANFRDLFLLGICSTEGGATQFLGLDCSTGEVFVVDYENDDLANLYQPFACSLHSMDSCMEAIATAVAESPVDASRLRDILELREPNNVTWHELAEHLDETSETISVAGFFEIDPQGFGDWSMSQTS